MHLLLDQQINLVKLKLIKKETLQIIIKNFYNKTSKNFIIIQKIYFNLEINLYACSPNIVRIRNNRNRDRDKLVFFPTHFWQKVGLKF